MSFDTTENTFRYIKKPIPSVPEAIALRDEIFKELVMESQSGVTTREHLLGQILAGMVLSTLTQETKLTTTLAEMINAFMCQFFASLFRIGFSASNDLQATIGFSLAMLNQVKLSSKQGIEVALREAIEARDKKG